MAHMSKRAVAFCLLVFLTVAWVAAVPASAQASNPPPFATPSTTLYAHHNTADTAELEGWMNTIEVDGDDTALGPSAACNNNPSGAQPVPFSENKMVDDALWGDPVDRTYTITLTPALTAAATMGTGPIKATIPFGSSTCGGHPTITSTLKSGSTIIAEGSAEHTYYNTGTGNPYDVLTLDMAVTATTLAASQPLIWTVHVVGTWYGAGFMGVGLPQGQSKLEIPIASVGPSGPVDSDSDGLDDAWETDNFGDLASDGAGDPDADGLNNTREQELETDPNDADTDGDGASDGLEDQEGTDPLDPASTPQPGSTTSPPSSSTGGPSSSSNPSSSAPTSSSGPTSSPASGANEGESTPAPAWTLLGALALLGVLLRRRA